MSDQRNASYTRFAQNRGGGRVLPPAPAVRRGQNTDLRRDTERSYYSGGGGSSGSNEPAQETTAAPTQQYTAPIGPQPMFNTRQSVASFGNRPLPGVTPTVTNDNRASNVRVNIPAQQRTIEAPIPSTVQPYTGSRPLTRGADIRENVVRGFTFRDAAEPGRSVTASTATPTDFAFAGGRLGRVGLELATTRFAGPIVNLYGRGVAAARVSRVGSIPGVRTVLSPGLPGTLSRGVIGAFGISSAERRYETMRLGGIEREYGVTGLRGAVDEGTRTFQSEEGFGRSIASGAFFGFTNRQRFEETQARSIQERTGLSERESRTIANEVFARRRNIRGVTDITVGVGVSETAGELGGRRSQVLFERYVLPRVSVTPRAATIGSRTFGSFVGGSIEGSLQVASSDIQDFGRTTPRRVAVGAGVGSVIAASGGGAIAFFGTGASRGSRRTATVIETGLDILDPAERPGDFFADSFTSGYKGVVLGGGGRRSTRTVGGSAFNFGFSASPTSASTPSRGVVPARTAAGTPSRSRSRTIDSFSNPFFAPVPTRNPSNVPARTPARTPVRTPANTFLNNFVPTNVPARVNTRVPNNVPTRVPTRVNTRVFTPEFPVFPPIGGGGGGGGGGAGRSRRRSDRYSASLTARVFGIRARRGGRQSGGFGGFEVRGI